MNGEEQVTLGELARSQQRLEATMGEIRTDLKQFTQAGVLRRLDEVEERLRWYGRWLLGLVGVVVVSGALTYISAVAR